MLNAQWRLVDEHFFETMGIPLLAGRDFDGRDLVDGTSAIVISDSLARVLFPEQEALGREVALDLGQEMVFQVVGVVDDVLMVGLGSGSSMAMYVLARQHPPALGRGMRVVVKTSGDPAALAPSVRAAVSDVDPRVAVSSLRPMSEFVDGSVRQPRFRAVLLSAFAGVALLLSLLGIYGLLAHFVSQRTREIGVRMALGATSAMVLRLVVGRGMKLLAVGVAVGLVGAWGAGKLLRTMLFGVEPTDPVSYLTVVAVFGIVALLGSIIPGWRAASIDPLEAIRTE
jgi:putative ABC transport system permease protein